MGPLKPFFHLTSAFFGLTSEYKIPLLEEIYICTQHLKNFTYGDVLNLPVYERRYYLGLLTKQKSEEQEYIDEMREKSEAKSTNSKGSRTTKVSGNALKQRMASGDIPLK